LFFVSPLFDFHGLVVTEFELLEAISENPLVTQGSLSDQLGIAVGSVNWYVKRLIKCGYISVTRLERTWLKYHLTPEGIAILTQRTLRYNKNSLKVYAQLRKKAKIVVYELVASGISHVYLDGNNEMMDILRLTCIEQGILITNNADDVVLISDGQDYEIIYKSFPIDG